MDEILMSGKVSGFTVIPLQPIYASDYLHGSLVPITVSSNVEEYITDNLLDDPGSSPIRGELSSYVNLESGRMQED